MSPSARQRLLNILVDDAYKSSFGAAPNTERTLQPTRSSFRSSHSLQPSPRPSSASSSDTEHHPQALKHRFRSSLALYIPLAGFFRGLVALPASDSVPHIQQPSSIVRPVHGPLASPQQFLRSVFYNESGTWSELNFSIPPGLPYQLSGSFHSNQLHRQLAHFMTRPSIQQLALLLAI